MRLFEKEKNFHQNDVKQKLSLALETILCAYNYRVFTKCCLYKKLKTKNQQKKKR